MKKIIDNKLYDTEKGEKIFNFRQRRKTGEFGNYNFYHWFDVDIYKTKKNNYFLHGHKEGYDPFIEVINKKDVKKLIQRLDPDKYIGLFGEVEEA